MSTVRNLRTTATAEISNLEQGMKRAAMATRQIGLAAQDTSRMGSRAMDELGRLVLSKVQMIGGITRTLTCPVVNL